MNWLEKVIGKSGTVGEQGTSPWYKQLVEGLAGLEKRKGVRSGLERDVIQFVVDGSKPGVLQELENWGRFGQFLGLTEYSPDASRSQRFYKDFETTPAEARLRWAQVLESGIGSRNSYWSLTFPGGVHWPEALLMHAAGRQMNMWQSRPVEAKALSFTGLQEIFAAAGMDSMALLVTTLSFPPQHAWLFENYSKALASLPGFSEEIALHQDQLRPILVAPAVNHRLHVLALLEGVESSVRAGFAAELAELATGSSKQVRAAAEPLVRACAAAAVPHLRRLAKEAKPNQRLYSLRLLWQAAADLNDTELQDFAMETASADKAPSVQALPVEWTQVAEQMDVAADNYEVTVPTVEWSGALTPEVSNLLTSLWVEINRAVDKQNEQMRKAREQAIAQGHKPYGMDKQDYYSDAALADLLKYIGSDAPSTKARSGGTRQANWNIVVPAMQRLAKQSAISPVAILKALAYFDLLCERNDRGLLQGASLVLNTMYASQGRPTLLELSQMLDELGLVGRDAIFASYCHTWGNPIARDWSAEATWPFFAHHVDRLIQLLGPSQGKDYWFDRNGLFRAVSTLPTPPVLLVNAMFDLALGSGKTDRMPAQEALHQLIGKEVRISTALSDGKAEVRAVAAQWLARLRCDSTIPALEKALAKEKHDVPKGAMLDALQAMGQPIEKYLDRKGLVVEASKSLSKGIPKDLEWFPWSALPTVHWSDSGETVAPEILRWLLVQAVKQKSPEPNAVLRKYCAMIVPRERSAFGQFLLETWLFEDTRPIPADEAMNRAQAQAAAVHASMKSSPQYYQDDPNLSKSVEELTALYLPGFLRQPAGSAIGSKGLLAVAASCAGEDAAAPVARFLKDYYGTRAAQGKALIAMLAWIEHPSATQLMLSVGNRFRTKSFQEEAARQAEALADRMGWTLAELSDRTIPSAGFDEAGVLELNYGQRVFSAHLLPDFKVELFNPEGKKIAALPEPRKDDDEVLAKDSKKAFSATKKQIKSIVTLQTDRLYEALCTGRNWSFEDWNLYLNKHPIVRRLVQRLVWSLTDNEGAVLTTFRPLDDGSLSDCEDSPVVPEAQARVQLAHDTNLPPDDVAKWQQHLVDYEIAPLFQQFGKGKYELPEGKANETSIEDFEGHLIEAFSLRGRAGKLGYARGSTEDGGWFMTYEKRFPTLGLVAVIEFTGNPLPEQNRTVALLNLSFTDAQGNSWERSAMLLSKVPAVLLSECYNDLRLIAAEGSGFDSDWQTKSQY